MEKNKHTISGDWTKIGFRIFVEQILQGVSGCIQILLEFSVAAVLLNIYLKRDFGCYNNLQ
jgi:hypothetical protein